MCSSLLGLANTFRLFKCMQAGIMSSCWYFEFKSNTAPLDAVKLSLFPTGRTLTPSYSHTSVLLSFRVCQTLQSSHFDGKNASAPGACSGLTALSGSCMSRDVPHPPPWHPPTPREDASWLSTRWFRHSSQVPEQLNDEYQGTTVYQYNYSFILFFYRHERV